MLTKVYGEKTERAFTHWKTFYFILKLQNHMHENLIEKHFADS